MTIEILYDTALGAGLVLFSAWCVFALLRAIARSL
jgi:hypothetical protein